MNNGQCECCQTIRTVTSIVKVAFWGTVIAIGAIEAYVLTVGLG